MNYANARRIRLNKVQATFPDKSEVRGDPRPAGYAAQVAAVRKNKRLAKLQARAERRGLFNRDFIVQLTIEERLLVLGHG